MLSIIFLYIGLSCVYIQTFPVLKEDIPSFRILRIIANNKKGVSEKEIIKLMGTTDLFNIKLTELEEDNFLKKENSKITLTNSGRILANIFIAYRKLLGLGRGDG
jgi:superfamily II helicase